MRRFRPTRVQWIVLGAALFAAAASLVTAWSAPPLNSADEAAHLDYAIDVWHGTLPVFEDGVTNRPPFGLIPSVQWVAQHPPFFYAVLAPVVGPLWDAGHPYAAVLAGRSVNAVFAALAVVAVGWATTRIVPRRPAVAGLAALVVALTPMFLLVGGSIYNDLPNAGLGALAIGIAATALRSGLTTRLVVGATVTTTLGGLTRLSFAVFIVAVVVAFLLARWRRGSFWGDWRGHVVAVVVVAVAPVAASAWFWLRNRALTGTIVGNHPEWGEQHLGRSTSTAREVLTDPAWWRDLFALYRGHLPGNSDWTYVLLVVPLLLAVVVGAVAAVRSLTTGRPAARHGAAPGRTVPGRHGAVTTGAGRTADLLVVAMLVAVTVCVLVGQVRFSMSGGAAHVRYALALMPVLAIPMAIGLDGLGRVLSPVVTVAWTGTAAVIWAQIQDLAAPAFSVPTTLVVSRVTFGVGVVLLVAVVVAICVEQARRGTRHADADADLDDADADADRPDARRHDDAVRPSAEADAATTWPGGAPTNAPTGTTTGP